jgi:glycolate oxidase
VVWLDGPVPAPSTSGAPIASPADAALVAALAAAIGPDQVRAAPVDLAVHGRDGSLLRGRPDAVCLPLSTEQVRACVLVAREHGRPVVARGSGTGLAGGAVPEDGAVVVSTTRMDRVLEVDAVERVAWVQPGVVNLDLTRAVEAHGLHFAPDPSSQQSCSVGGNVATNSGGPHCLAYGTTSAHVLAVEVVLPSGEVAVLGGLDPEPPGLDLRGVFVGSEGTFGIATRIAVRLTPLPPAVQTLLAAFASLDDAAAAVSAVIASGVVPAALEMMDRRCVEAVEAYVGAGYPTDAAAVLLAEVDGLPDGVAIDGDAVAGRCREHGATSVRVAADDAERALLWKGRKTAFGAVARIAPDYHLHDTVVPRTRLVEVLRKVVDIAARHDLVVLNVFHAGDGNLHPLLVFDARTPGALERVHAAGEEIVRASLDAGGVLSGEHGIGIEKRDLMGLQFSAVSLDAQARVRQAFDPDGVANPTKLLPSGSRCLDLGRALADGLWV